MANNRLFIQDTETGDVLLVAKSLGPTWYWQTQTSEQIDEWLNDRDWESAAYSTPTKLRLVTEHQLVDEGYQWRDGHMVNDAFGEDDPGKTQGEQG